MQKFLAIFDAHVGFERLPGEARPSPLHDPKALGAVWKFAEDFKPDRVILGGDILDCGPVSHHNRKTPGKTEGLRMRRDFELCRELVIDPAAEVLAPDGKLDYLIGNHEDWLQDLSDEIPGLEGVVDVKGGLDLSDSWRVHRQGTILPLSRHLLLVHGDVIKGGGEQKAKAAVIQFERSIRFGHFHSYQTYTKTSSIDIELPRTGINVPCLCKKSPRYTESSPQRWAQGFLWGYIMPNGTFSDYVSIIISGRFTALGKEYRG